jgi:hypothetical protein
MLFVPILKEIPSTSIVMVKWLHNVIILAQYFLQRSLIRLIILQTTRRHQSTKRRNREEEEITDEKKTTSYR